MMMLTRRLRLVATAASLGLLSGCVALGGGDVDRTWGLGETKLAAPPPAPASPPPAESKPDVAAPTKATAMVIAGGGSVVGSVTASSVPVASSSVVETSNVAPTPTPDDPWALAVAATRNFDNLGAAAQYQRVLDTNPDNLDAALGLAGALLGDGMRDKAEAVATDLVKRYPSEPRVTLLLARIDLAAGKLSDAAVHLISGSAKTPDSRDALLTRGILEDMRGDHAAARAAYRRGLLVAPDDTALQSNLALSLAAAGEPAEGIAILEKLLPTPATAPAAPRHNLALAYGVAGREDDARRLLAIDLTPSEIDENIRYYREFRGKFSGN